MPSNELNTRDVLGNKTGLTSHICPKRNESRHPCQDRYANVHHSFFFFFIINKNNPNVHHLENRSTSCDMSTSWSTMSIKKNKLLVRTTTWMNLQKYHVNAKKPATKYHTPYDFVYSVSSWQNHYRDRKQTCGYQCM